ncbi:DUF1385 domain-containing protein [Oscillospiraceae bacterium DSM 107454]|uniref:DUF1385 domain-containing protein n=2 Tax=Ructibacterium gallinarum TaxID=2779355 RepID=A0A9D5R7N7_9FIRM|nr:DUF1385 domain-containing protein [Ructibacterium gallinarum]
MHRTSIGGQAVMEGVMMRGPHLIATAVRKPDGDIIVDKQTLGKIRSGKFVKLPIIRGCVNFFDSMIIGVKALMFSAQFFDVDDEGNPVEQKPSRFEVWLEKKLDSEKAMNVILYCSVIFSLILSIGLFILLPTFLTGFLRPLISTGIFLTLIEGAVRIFIFICYLSLVSQMKDIKRVFMYHGAEHKSIFCYEKGLELNVANVRKQSRFHPRCGTSFLLIVMVISILVFSIIPWDEATFASIPGIGPWLVSIPWVITRMILRLLLLPVVAGLSYEIIKYAGRHDNAFTRAISAPGMWFQRITTNEPDDSMIEVAIAALQTVIPENQEEDKW